MELLGQRKAGGQIDGIYLYGRKEATATSGSTPEKWEFQVRLVKKDAEIGQPSNTIPQIVRA